MSMTTHDPRSAGLPRGRRRAALTLLPALAVLGIILLGPNQALGTAFITAAVAGAASAAALVVMRSRRG